MKNFFKFLTFLILVAAVVGGVILVSKNQETRKGATAAETSSSILPSAVTVTAGQNFNVHVWMNTGKDTDKLMGAEFSVSFDQNKVEFVSAVAENGYTILNDNLNGEGGGVKVFKMVTLGAEKSGAVSLVNLTFKKLGDGSGTIGVLPGSAKLMISGQSDTWAVSVNNSSNYSVAGGATAVPTVPGTTVVPTVIPTTAPITGQDFVLNYKMAFGNVNSNSAKCAINWPLDITVSANEQTKSYEGVMPTTREAVGNKLVFGGSLNLVGFAKNSGVSVFVSGPKHPIMKYGKDKQVSSFNQVDGELVLDKTTNLVYDFSDYPMIAGDVVSSGSTDNQDGVINGVDFAYIKSKSLIHETVAEGGSLKGDLDGNCQVNSNDVNIIKMSLQEKQDQLY